MEVRENKLHEPKIIKDSYEQYNARGAEIGKVYYAIARCSICDCHLSDKTGITEELAVKNVVKSISNYCPRCGARLKEINNENEGR